MSDDKKCDCEKRSAEDIANISHNTIMPFGELFPDYDLFLPYEPQMAESEVEPYNEQAQGVMPYGSKNNKNYDIISKMDAYSDGIELSQTVNNAILQYLRNEFDLTNNNAYRNRGNTTPTPPPTPTPTPSNK